MVDEDEHLIVRLLRRTPPVQEAIDIAVSERILNVIRPSNAITLRATGSVPVVIDSIEGAPFGLPNMDTGVERRAGVRAVAVRSNKSQVLLLVGSLDARKACSLLLPAAAVAACDLGLQACCLESWMQHFDKVCSLAATGLHGGIWCAQVRLVEEANVVDRYSFVRVVLNVFHDLVGVALSPILAVAGCGCVVDAAQIPSICVGVYTCVSIRIVVLDTIENGLPFVFM